MIRVPNINAVADPLKGMLRRQNTPKDGTERARSGVKEGGSRGRFQGKENFTRQEMRRIV